MRKIISILGSTGSIGTQTLDVARKYNIKIEGLSANSSIKLLEEQIREFRPKYAAVMDAEKAAELKDNIKDTDTKVYSGLDGLKYIASHGSAETLVTAVVGMIGLEPTLEAINAGRNIALANKETLVTAGEIVIKAAHKKNIKIYPVDSEHSAIYQCIAGNMEKDIRKIILTASGGPFFGYKRNQLKNVTKKDALAHPTWNMGAKITIDSATLMNKGFELIEAVHLFGINPHDVEIAVHRQSIIHSMVEYNDYSIIAQMSTPDMRLPISYALSCPERKSGVIRPLDLFKINPLTFERADEETFTCLSTCKKAVEIGGTMPCAVNAANEICVDMFLKEKIKFLDIFDITEKMLDIHDVINNPCLDDVLKTDLWARNKAYDLCSQILI